MKKAMIFSIVIAASLLYLAVPSFAQEEVRPAWTIHDEIGYYEDIEKAMANKENVRHLNLKYKGLQKFPMQVFQFPNLELLDLAHNNISSIPDEISSLQNLKELYINVNNIKKVPESLKKMRLDVLYIQQNPVNDDPDLYEKLPKNVKNLQMGNPPPGYEPKRTPTMSTQPPQK